MDDDRWEESVLETELTHGAFYAPRAQRFRVRADDIEVALAHLRRWASSRFAARREQLGSVETIRHFFVYAFRHFTTPEFDEAGDWIGLSATLPILLSLREIAPWVADGFLSFESNTGAVVRLLFDRGAARFQRRVPTPHEMDRVNAFRYTFINAISRSDFRMKDPDVAVAQRGDLTWRLAFLSSVPRPELYVTITKGDGAAIGMRAPVHQDISSMASAIFSLEVSVSDWEPQLKSICATLSRIGGLVPADSGNPQIVLRQWPRLSATWLPVEDLDFYLARVCSQRLRLPKAHFGEALTTLKAWAATQPKRTNDEDDDTPGLEATEVDEIGDAISLQGLFNLRDVCVILDPSGDVVGLDFDADNFSAFEFLPPIFRLLDPGAFFELLDDSHRWWRVEIGEASVRYLRGA